MTPGDILAAYVAVGHQLADLTRPYALRLLYLLAILEILAIALMYMTDEDSPGAIFGRGIRFIFLTGFAYWWIENSWNLAVIILGSFNQLGENITGLPDLTPVGFIQIGTKIAEILWNAPSSAHWIPDIALALGEIMLAILILIIMLLIAGIVIFTLAAAWLIIGPGSILVPLMVNRFTSRIAEGYFTWLMRTGVMLLFFFVVLGVAQNFAQQWSNTLTTACGAGPGGACTAPIPVPELLTLLGSTVILAFICIGVPFTAGHIVTGGVNMALEHIASARYIAGSGIRAASHTNSPSRPQAYNPDQMSKRMEQRLQAGARAAQTTRLTVVPSQAPTQRSLKP